MRRAIVDEEAVLTANHWSYTLSAEQQNLLRDNFDANQYVETYFDGGGAVEDAFDYFMAEGWKADHNPSSSFSTRFYRESYPDVAASGQNPFVHWILFGQAEGRPVSLGPRRRDVATILRRFPQLSQDEAIAVAELFDEAYYRLRYTDVAVSGQDMIDHYLEYGWKEFRNPSPNFYTFVFCEINADWREIGNPFVYWACKKFRTPARAEMARANDLVRFSPDGQWFSDEEQVAMRHLFDPAFYIARYLDETFDEDEAFAHYMGVGWRDLNDPSIQFDTQYYLKRYGDILTAKVNPFSHWVFYGRAELRRSIPFYAELALKEDDLSVSMIIMTGPCATDFATTVKEADKQTRRCTEIIVMSDQSSPELFDGLTGIETQDRTSIRICPSDPPGGSVGDSLLHRAIDMATGAIVWFCRSGDYYDRDYLQRLIPSFKDLSVMLAFGRQSDVIGHEAGTAAVDFTKQPLAPDHEQGSFVCSAPVWFSSELAQRVAADGLAGCLWRRAHVADRTWHAIHQGDRQSALMLNLHMAAGGQVAYDAKAGWRVKSQPRTLEARSGGADAKQRFAELLEAKRRWGVPVDASRLLADVDASGGHGRADAKLLQVDLDFPAFYVILGQQRVIPHILVTFWAIKPGGGEYFPIMLANELRRSGYIVSMLCFEMSFIDRDMRDCMDPSIAVYDAAWVDEYGADNFLRDMKISLVHSHTVGSEVRFFDVWNTSERPPYLVTLHGSYENSDIEPEVMDKIAVGVSHFVYTADKNLLPFAGLGLSKKRFTKLPNAMPLDTLPFPRSRAELGIGSDAIVFVLVARGVKEKGWEPLIASFRRLAATVNRPLHLLLCGGGPETERMQARYGSDRAISFLGYQRRIHGLYRLGDICMVPSRFLGESFPLCIIQALQCGTPVIGTDVGEIPAMLTEPDGAIAGCVVKSTEDETAFEEGLFLAMREMLGDQKRKKCCEVASRLGLRFRMDDVARSYERIYFQLIHQGSLVQ